MSRTALRCAVGAVPAVTLLLSATACSGTTPESRPPPCRSS